MEITSELETDLVDQLRLLHFILVKALNAILDNFPPLLDTLRKRM